MRTIKVPVCIGVMKSTENSEDPITCLANEPYGSGGDGYHWYRTTVSIPIQSDVVEVHSDGPEKVTVEKGQ